MREEWRPVVGYEECYQVSSEGRVKSIERTVTIGMGKKKKMPEKIMNQYSHYRGHLFVFLQNNGNSRKEFVHRIVAFAFLENPDEKPIVNHLDGIKTNNKLENLEWATGSENTQHYYDHIRPKVKALEEVDPTEFEEDINEIYP